MLRYGFLSLFGGWILLIVEGIRWLLNDRWAPYSLDGVFALTPEFISDGLAEMFRDVCQAGLWAVAMIVGFGLIIVFARPITKLRDDLGTQS